MSQFGETDAAPRSDNSSQPPPFLPSLLQPHPTSFLPPAPRRTRQSPLTTHRAPRNLPAQADLHSPVSLDRESQPSVSAQAEAESLDDGGWVSGYQQGHNKTFHSTGQKKKAAKKTMENSGVHSSQVQESRRTFMEGEEDSTRLVKEEEEQKGEPQTQQGVGDQEPEDGGWVSGYQASSSVPSQPIWSPQRLVSHRQEDFSSPPHPAAPSRHLYPNPPAYHRQEQAFESTRASPPSTARHEITSPGRVVNHRDGHAFVRNPANVHRGPLFSAALNAAVTPPSSYPSESPPMHQIPTFHPRESPGDLPPRLRHSAQHDPNRQSVPHPRPWGAPPLGRPPSRRFEDADEPPQQQQQQPAPLLSDPEAFPPISSASVKSTKQESSAASVATSGGEWGSKEAQLKKWARNVSSAAAPPETSLVGEAEQSRPEGAGDEQGDGGPTRPDSTPPVAPPVTVYVSEDETSVESPPLPTPPLLAQPPLTNVPPARRERPPSIMSVSRQGANAEVFEPVPEVATAPNSPRVVRPLEIVPPPSAGATQSWVDAAIHSPPYSNFTGTDGGRRRRNGRRIDGQGAAASWPFWRKAPHPATSPSWADRRLMVEFPCMIRKEHVRQTMTLHFSRYGHLRLVWHWDEQGDSCGKAIVVFDSVEGFQKCLADPRRHECEFRSAARVASTMLELKIRHCSASMMTRTVLIQVVGDRYDTRTRSASPRQTREREGRREANEVPRLPPSLRLVALPWPRRGGPNIDWQVTIESGTHHFLHAVQRSRERTGREPRPVGEVDMRRRVAEKDFIPKLCSYFGEMVEFIPPTQRGQGWLVTVAGKSDALHLMNEMGKIPGIVSRWAHEGDGHFEGEGYSVLDDNFDMSPMTRLENLTEGPIARSVPTTQQPRHADSPTPHLMHSEDGQQAPVHEPPLATLEGVQPQPLKPMPDTPPKSPHTALPSPQKVSPPTSATSQLRTARPRPPANQQSPPWSGDAFPHHLQKQLVYMYKGRRLQAVESEGQTRYYDPAAVFVGRLVKTRETKDTLWHRFAKYGRIVEVEYNPVVTNTTYATARILYQAEDMAQRAIEFEAGQVSFGSAIKVEPRRVLPLDVTTREMFVDPLGRCVSPSMMSQYSPPSARSEPSSRHPAAPPPPPAVPPPGFNPYSPTPFFQAPPFVSGHPQLAQASPPMQPFPFGWPIAPLSAPPATAMPSYGQMPPPTPGPGQATLDSAPVPSACPPIGAVPYFAPMLYAMGIAYYPPPVPGMSLTSGTPHPNPTIPHHTPPTTPAVPPPPPGSSSVDSLAHLPQGLPSPSDFRYGENSPAAQSEHRAPLMDGADQESRPSQGTSSLGSLRPITMKMENGVLKPVYDPEELRRYREEHGLAHPEPEARRQVAEAHPEARAEVPSRHHRRSSDGSLRSHPGVEIEDTGMARSTSERGTPRRGQHDERSRTTLVPVPVPFSPPVQQPSLTSPAAGPSITGSGRGDTKRVSMGPGSRKPVPQMDRWGGVGMEREGQGHGHGGHLRG